MNVELWVWGLTIGALFLVLLIDFIIQVRNPHEPSFRESAFQVSIYVSLALLFSLVIGGVWGAQYAQEYFAGFITEYSLSVDNMFVLLVIFTQFAVPKELRSQALLIGIAVALFLRFLFIILGAAFIDNFSWAFYAFGAFLLVTAFKLMKDTYDSLKRPGEENHEGGSVVKFLQKHMRTTREYHGNTLFIKKDGVRFATPLLLVMIAIGFTDLLFALDSIPAIYGLTNVPYIVFMANVFALLGLRQLYFLLGGLMGRLKLLGVGLSLILAWIGIKLVIHALHKNELPFINGGEKVTLIPEIPTELSLLVISSTLLVTTSWSLALTAREKRKLDPKRQE